ncbi:MAG: UDP-N-acetylmuramoyl-tripeptide--D-alanyl-D-alanine ligase [Nitrospirota bacterium]|nr:UDP-N-acetylmuramoyl-tripeptide--D-alanyl-D-alanine ligase [Nitrospirota bacterium]
MAAFTAEEIILATGGVLLQGTKSQRVSRVCTDSRLARKGDVFFALQGEDFDGHQFVDQVVACGVGGIVIDEGCAEQILDGLTQDAGAVGSNGLFVIGVDDTLIAYQELAAFHRRRFEIPVIAITGSNGKTTTKEMVARTLAQRWCVLKTEANFNNRIGVPQTLFQLTEQHEVAVLEMGVDAEGQTTRLCEIATPTIGVVTNIGPDHLEFFGSLDGSARAKAEILSALPNDGTIVLNSDDTFFPFLKDRVHSHMVSFGFNANAQFRASAVAQVGDQTTFRAQVPDQSRGHQVSVKVHGQHNVLNAMAAVAVGRVLGLSMEKIKAGLADFRPVDMRSQIRRDQGFTIIEDCYNANPASMKAAIDLLVEMGKSNQTIAVLGDMLELGHEANQLHRDVGAYVSAQGVTRLVACGNLGKEFAKGARAHGMSQEAVMEVPGANDASTVLADVAQVGDVILLKASRGMRLERVLQHFPSSKPKH